MSEQFFISIVIFLMGTAFGYSFRAIWVERGNK